MNKLILFIAFFSVHAFANGGQFTPIQSPAGLGGDAVYCEKSTANKFHGYYSLDYLAQYSSTKPIEPVGSFEEQMDRMEQLIRVMLPEMALEWFLYREGLFSSDLMKLFVWEEAPFGLIDVEDEELIAQVPDNCRHDGKVRIVQATRMLIPQQGGTTRIFIRYVPEVINELKRTDPVQLSFLVMRAFLTNYYGTQDQNRRVTYYMHAHSLDWSRKQWAAAMSATGFHLPVRSFPDFVSSYCVKNNREVERQLVRSLQDGQILGMYARAYGFEFERQNNCPGGGCTYLSFTDYAEPMRTLHMHKFVRFTYERGFFNVLSDPDGGHFTVPTLHMSCPVDFTNEKIGECGPFKNKEGKVLGTRRPFTLALGPKCINVITGGKVPHPETDSTTYWMLSILLDQ